MAAMLDAPWSGAQFSPPTPLDIATIEAAILERLRAQISSIEIAHFPDQPETYRMTHRVGAALVSYRSSTYGPQLDTFAVVQERKLEFDVTVMMRDLGWSLGGAAGGPSPGAYAMLEAIRAALTGFQVPGSRKMYPLRERFLRRDKQGGLWVYAITFGLSTVALEAAAADNYPLFVKGTALLRGGQTVTTVGQASFVFDGSGVIALPHQNVTALSVTDPGGATLNEGADFTLDPVNGTLTALPGGAVGAGDSVIIAYSYAERITAIEGQSAPLG